MNHNNEYNCFSSGPSDELLNMRFGDLLSTTKLPKKTQQNKQNTSTTQFLKVHKRFKHFIEEDIQMANKHLKRCSIPLIRKMQNKTIMRYDYTPIRMSKLKKIGQDNALPLQPGSDRTALTKNGKKKGPHCQQ